MPRFFSPRSVTRHAALMLIVIACHGAAFAQTGSTGSDGTSTPASTPCPGGASGTGAACSPAGGVATAPTAPTPDPAVANPINLITGNKYQREVDLPPLPGVLGLEIVRHYNSTLSGRDSRNGLLGRGWKLSYETTLSVDGPLLDIHQADGSRLTFSRDLVTPQRYHAATPWQGEIFADKKAHGTEYTWVWPNGRQLNFNASGQLVQIAAPTGEFVSLQYDAKGLLVQVTDPQGRRLHLNYLDKRDARAGDRFRGVQSIDSPIGRFTYAYGSELPPGATAAKSEVLANLVKVSIPTHYDAEQKVHPWANRGVSSSSISRIYHYEDARYPTLLTGISVNGQGSDGQLIAQRLSTYGYDAQGLANLSVKGTPLQMGKDGKPLPGTGLEQVTLAWPREGTVVLTNSLGQRTTYKTATIGGEPRILEARGPGCSTCGPTDRRYRYDESGRLTEETVLGTDGQPIKTTRTTLDGYGRAMEIGTIAYRNGKAQPARWQVRYRYPVLNEANPGEPHRVFSNEPGVIARPSVVPGKEHQIRIAYNAAGQPLSVIESGWAPAVNGGEASEITRTTNYRYQAINGRSVLAEIDGPLKNGPKNSPDDSDITRVSWDSHGNAVTTIVAPGTWTTHIVETDFVGRPTLVEKSDGVNPSHKTKTTYNHRGQPLRMARLLNAGQAEPDTWHAWLPHWLAAWFGTTQSDNTKEVGITYDANDRPQRLRRPDGSWITATYDTAGRLTGWQDRDGNVIRRELDNEGQLLATLLQSAALDLKTSYRYDEHNRLTQTIAANQVVTAYAYDPSGQLATVTDALQRQTAYRYDAYGRIESVLQNAQIQDPALTRFGYAAGTGMVQSVTDANGAATNRIVDDFGRALVLHSADRGHQVAQYDDVDRLVENTDANGNQMRYTWNAAGQLIESITTGKNSTGAPETETVRYRYQGALVTSVSNTHQNREYRHDADDRVVEISDTIYRSGKEPPLRWSEHYGYDKLNRLTSRTLASGETVRLTYDHAGRLQKMNLVSADGKTSRPLATNIGVHAFADLTTFTHGNGVTTTYERDRHTGQLTKLHVAPQGSTIASVANTLSALIPDTYAQGKQPTSSASSSTQKGLYAQALEYDAIGRIIGISRSKEGNPEKEKYSYDSFDHLTHVESTHEQTDWTYDAVGNRTTAVANGEQKTLAYQPASNRLKSISSSGGETAYAYDAAGNPVAIGDKKYTYNVTGRLAQVSVADKFIATYTHNAQGERIAKTTLDANGKQTTTYFLYHGHQLDAEADEAGNITAYYVYFGHIPIAKIEYIPQQINGPNTIWLTHVMAWLGLADDSKASRIYAIHADHLGAPQLATDSQRHIVWQASYTAFGKAAVSVSGISLNLRLPGQYFDRETGTHYNYFRDYDPQTGRYVQSDPIGLAGGINSYSYAISNPLSGSDPFGLYTVYWGGAGLDGPYIDDQIKALQGEGVVNITRGGGGNGNTILDAAHVTAVRYQGGGSRFYDVDPESKKLMCPEQTNYIGYSYGSLLAAHTALYWANNGRVIDNLVLVGSPIDSNFLTTLRANKNIKNTLVYDLRLLGDPIYAGMTAAELAFSVPILGLQISQTPRGGHFYYNPDDTATSQIGIDRRKSLAENIYRVGVR